MSEQFVDLLSSFIDRNFFKKGHGTNLPQCNANIFYEEMKSAGFEVITYEQLIRLIQNHGMYKRALNKSQASSRKQAEEFLDKIGIN